MPVELPEGIVASLLPAEGPRSDVLVAPVREQRYEIVVEDRDGKALGPLEGVTGGELTWYANASVKGTGTIDLTDVQMNSLARFDLSGDPKSGPTWSSIRLRVTGVIEGWGTEPLGVWVPSVPIEKWTASGRSWSVEVADMCTLPDSDTWFEAPAGSTAYRPSAFHAPKGANVIQLVRDKLLAQVDPVDPTNPDRLRRQSKIENDPAAILNRNLSFGVETTLLKIINDLLDAVDYFSLWVDGDGFFQTTKYAAPAKRPPKWVAEGAFTAGRAAVWSPEYEVEKDLYTVPNRLVAISQAEEGEPSLVGMAELPGTHPLSRQYRGRWITQVETDVAKTTQKELDAWAARRLETLAGVTMSTTIQHLWMPGLKPNDTLRLVGPGLGDAGMYSTVVKTTLSLNPLSLCQTDLREVQTDA